MKNIILIGAKLSNNLGGPSLAVSTIEVIKRVYPDASFTLLVPDHAYNADKHLEDKYLVSVLPFQTEKVITLLLINKILRLNLGSKRLQETVNRIKNSDLIIDIWGIMFADSFRSKSFISKLREGLRLILGKIVKVPLVKYTAAMGPFQSKWNKFFAKFYLNKCVNTIFARDKVTEKYLIELGIKKPIYCAPDTAFLLPVTEITDSDNRGNLIGLSVSYQARNRYHEPEQYMVVISDFIRYIHDNYKLKILLIPNEVEDGKDDDVKIAEEINKIVSNDCCEVLDTSELTASEIKGVINNCEMIIAARYHTIVSSLSLGIPTLALGWHHKYVGVMRLFNQEEWVLDIQTFKLSDICHTFDEMWNVRKKLRSEISTATDLVQKKVLMVGKQIKENLEG